MDHIKRIDRELAYKGRIVDFYQDTMELPDGSTEVYDLVHHRMGAAAVVAVADDGRLVMVRQFRPALERETLEIPAGARNSTEEDTKVTALRELEEETGYRAGKITKLLSIKSTVAFCDEFIDVYLAGELTPTHQSLDPDEFIDVEFKELDELLEMIDTFKIEDSKTVAGILAYYRYLADTKNQTGE